MSPTIRHLLSVGALILLSITTLLAQSGTVPDDIYWDNQYFLSGQSGFSGSVKALAAVGDDIFVGGLIEKVPGIPSKGIVRWNRTSNSWFPVGNGVDGAVYAMAVSGDDLYVGGAFITIDGDTVNSIARWNRTTEKWSGLGKGVGYKGNVGVVKAIVVAGDSVYIGGQFDVANGDSVGYIAVWNTKTETWHPLGGGVDYDVTSIAADGSNVYVGGGFDRAGGIAAHRIARWDRTRHDWYSLGGGRQFRVYAIAVKDGEVYAGGMDFMAKYNANGWTVLGDGINGIVLALAFNGNDLYASGHFEQADKRVVNKITRWDGSGWQPLGTGIFFGTVPNSEVAALAAANGQLLVGGKFSAAGSILTSGIAIWDGTQWSNLSENTVETGNGVSGTPTAVAVVNGDVYVGSNGWLSAAGDVRSAGALMYDHMQGKWIAPGEGLQGQYLRVNAIVPHGDQIFFGGQFKMAGTDSALNVAVWDRTTGVWSRLGKGIVGTVQCMVAHGDTLFVGGTFTVAGSDSVRNIAAWDVSRQQWFPLGNGISRMTTDSTATVMFMTVVGSSLYVAGDFTRAGTADAARFARWNITEGEWESVGGGVYGGGIDTLFEKFIVDRTRVTSLISSGNRMVVAGKFSHIGEVDASAAVIFDGSTGTWNSLPNVVSIQYAVLHGNWLYASGAFLGTGNDTISGLAVADIRVGNWRLLGSGITRGYPNALAVDETGLYVVGSIEEAGGKPSLGIARWMNVPASVPTVADVIDINASVQPNPFSQHVIFRFTLEQTEQTRLDICTPDGRVVATVTDATLHAGTHSIEWKSGDLPEGLYIYRLRAGSQVHSGSVMLVR